MTGNDGIHVTGLSVIVPSLLTPVYPVAPYGHTYTMVTPTYPHTKTRLTHVTHTHNTHTIYNTLQVHTPDATPSRCDVPMKDKYPHRSRHDEDSHPLQVRRPSRKGGGGDAQDGHESSLLYPDTDGPVNRPRPSSVKTRVM